MPFSLLDLEKNGTCEGMNVTQLTRLLLLHYRVKVETPKMHVNTTEPWLIARWKARVDFLLNVIELLFLSLTVDALQGKTCQNSLLFGGGAWVSLSQDFRGRGRPSGIFFGF